MITSRKLQACMGMLGIAVGFGKDLVGNEVIGIGFAQLTVIVFGCFVLLSAWRTPRFRPISDDLLRLILLLLGGLGLMCAMTWHIYGSDGHIVDFPIESPIVAGFWIKKILLIASSVAVTLLGIYLQERQIVQFNKGLMWMLRAQFFRKTAQNLGIVIVTLFMCLVGFEIFLRTGIWDDGPFGRSPFVWTPEKYRKIDQRIDQENYKISLENRHGFSDVQRTFTKPPGVRRLAVLGDSFIWGDGIPNDLIWSHRLEAKVSTKYPDIEVLSWGKNGWSTLDQLEFLMTDGIKYDIDFLLVGWVVNDPDLGTFHNKEFRWQDGRLVSILRIVLPNAVSFVVSYTNNVMRRYFLADYEGPDFFSEKNLWHYSLILQAFREYCREHDLPFTFVLTPNGPQSFDERFDKIMRILEALKIPYLNTLPEVNKKLGHFSAMDLRANRADGHPGERVTRVFADEAFKYLENTEFLR